MQFFGSTNKQVFPAWEFQLQGREKKSTNYTTELLDLLLEHLPSHCQVHFGHRLVSCREYEDRRGCGVELHFRNGVTLDGYDLVIGADGLKSVVRQTVIAQSRGWTGLDASVKDLGFPPNMTKEEHCHLGRRHDILYMGQSAFRGLVPREKLAALYPDHRSLNYCRISAFDLLFGLLPIYLFKVLRKTQG
ncbi:hypothetical protein F5890DRAFT_1627896 [Lentinula detonsa]|uniref:FAD-binding domain-containing protein n=1 Tax=Lentinula detonsa TaxID=2804962 RepID=A0AA38PRZ8_9AGAR|nr:hypothetical protein F5890DRAFT_1627896 [Lentinula detonsa]